MRNLDLLVDMVKKFMVETYGKEPFVDVEPLNEEFTKARIVVRYDSPRNIYGYAYIVEEGNLVYFFGATLTKILTDMTTKMSEAMVDHFVHRKDNYELIGRA